MSQHHVYWYDSRRIVRPPGPVPLTAGLGTMIAAQLELEAQHDFTRARKVGDLLRGEP